MVPQKDLIEDFLWFLKKLFGAPQGDMKMNVCVFSSIHYLGMLGTARVKTDVV